MILPTLVLPSEEDEIEPELQQLSCLLTVAGD